MQLQTLSLVAVEVFGRAMSVSTSRARVSPPHAS